MGSPLQGEFWTPRPVSRAWGELIILTQPKPAAGANWKFTIPSTYLYRIVSLRQVLTTSAQVATRLTGAKLLDSTGKCFYEDVATTGVPASKVVGVSAGMDLSTTNAIEAAAKVISLPEMLLPPEWVVEGSTPEIQTEDQYGELIACVERFEPQPDHPIAEINNMERKARLLERLLNG